MKDNQVCLNVVITFNMTINFICGRMSRKVSRMRFGRQSKRKLNNSMKRKIERVKADMDSLLVFVSL